MPNGPKQLIYPAKDLAAAKAVFGALLGTEPYADAPYYVGFRVGDVEIGLDPNGHQDGPVAYFEVADIRAAFQQLLDAGAQVHQDVHDVGGGKLIGTLRDPGGNLVGLSQA
jgi:predicted enzyme related to lactoylglutathione lyase